MIYVSKIDEVFSYFAVWKVIAWWLHVVNEIWSSLIFFRMIESAFVTSWTLLWLGRICFYVRTRLCLIHHRMIILLLPTMTVFTTSHVLTTISIMCNESSSPPILAKMFMIILKDIRLSPKILPIMTINTLWFIVFFVKWTKLSFIVIHIEICVFCHLMNDTFFQFFCAVGEGTIISIFALG